MICSDCCHNSILAGSLNEIRNGTVCYSVIGAGAQNIITGNSKHVVIVGGYGNTACNVCHSLVAGSYLTAASNTTSVQELVKVSGTFAIPNPEPGGTGTLYHSFVEAPTAGENIYRHRLTAVGCRAETALPDYHRFLNGDEQVLVGATSHFGAGYGWVDDQQRRLTICTDSDGDYDVFLIATRKDRCATMKWCGAERMEKEYNG